MTQNEIIWLVCGFVYWIAMSIHAPVPDKFTPTYALIFFFGCMILGPLNWPIYFVRQYKKS